MPTLNAILTQKQYLEEQLEDANTYTEQLETVWENTELELKKKVDAYGYVIDDILTHIEYLKTKKNKLNEIQKKLELEIENIKTRLNYHCKENPLVGNEYKFYPYTSVTKTVNLDNINDEESIQYGTYTLKIPAKDFTKIENLVHDHGDNLDLLNGFNNAKYSCNVTDLPETHSAIIKKITPSVRIK